MYIFGFIPETPLKLYKGPSIQWQHIPSILEAHALVKDSGCHNYLKCRILVNTHLITEKWEYYLTSSWIRKSLICLNMACHFSIGVSYFNRSRQLLSTENNHTSTLTDIEHVGQYVQEELRYEAIIGPFDTVPCQLHISQLMTRAKQDSDNKQTIMDFFHGIFQSMLVFKKIFIWTLVIHFVIHLQIIS